MPSLRHLDHSVIDVVKKVVPGGKIIGDRQDRQERLHHALPKAELAWGIPKFLSKTFVR